MEIIHLKQTNSFAQASQLKDSRALQAVLSHPRLAHMTSQCVSRARL